MTNPGNRPNFLVLMSDEHDPIVQRDLRPSAVDIVATMMDIAGIDPRKWPPDALTRTIRESQEERYLLRELTDDGEDRHKTG